MEKSLKSISTNYGVYLGVSLAAVSIIVYAVMIDLFTEWWLGILLFVLIIGFGTAAGIKSRTLKGGFISFKEAFTAYFITIALGTFISTVVGIIIFGFIDPEAGAYLDEKIITMTRETMENWGAPQDSINETMTQMEGQDSFSTVAQIKSYFSRLLILSVLGLIVAVIVKRKDPNEA
ncbi:MAG: DUF4199 domain-containing protein [Psychroserpens sp.]|uniref:DUF4199 domain-containing protein n=1 Tax=Psychroserpens sp. TaxID=2020870 RepID=UPI003C789966